MMPPPAAPPRSSHQPALSSQPNTILTPSLLFPCFLLEYFLLFLLFWHHWSVAAPASTHPRTILPSQQRGTYTSCFFRHCSILGISFPPSTSSFSLQQRLIIPFASHSFLFSSIAPLVLCPPFAISHPIYLAVPAHC
ncbi:hypothetical protein GQ54DRAFT_84816 [Martensiomyces pterosporus]|nr:hypothetical protein GQ54DRAFT_84816 [Martensiomyces pterosporus]